MSERIDATQGIALKPVKCMRPTFTLQTRVFAGGVRVLRLEVNKHAEITLQREDSFVLDPKFAGAITCYETKNMTVSYEQWNDSLIQRKQARQRRLSGTSV
jgi:hypothetical protein